MRVQQLMHAVAQLPRLISLSVANLPGEYDFLTPAAAQKLQRLHLSEGMCGCLRICDVHTMMAGRGQPCQVKLSDSMFVGWR